MSKEVNDRLRMLQEDMLKVIGSPWALVSVPPRQGAIQPPSPSSNRLNAHSMGLLELACLGNPEKTIQGEMVYGLRALGWNVVQEAGYLHSEGRRNLDMLVFCKGERQSGEKLCVVEMKHLSSHQGSPVQLTRKMDQDCALPRPSSCPIMHVGFFTTVVSIDPQPLNNIGIYRFPKTYCKVLPGPTRSFPTDVDHWVNENKSYWQIPPARSQTPPRSESFSINENGKLHIVKGYVEFVVATR